MSGRIGAVLWVAFTGLLSLYFSLASDSSPYGPLLAIVALTLWSMLGSLAGDPRAYGF